MLYQSQMGIGPIVSLAGSYISSLLSGSSGHTTPPASASAGVKQDTSLISPFAQILGTLQQLQQSSPAQYSQVANQLAVNLSTGSTSAASSGNATLATQLAQLSKDFQTASSSGQLPNVSDLAQAIGGAHHAAHRNAGVVPRAATDTATDPLSIISGTLNSAGVQTL